MDEINVVIYGVGAIGERIVKVVLAKRGLRIVGAVDMAEGKVGRDLGEVMGMGRRLGVTVTDDPNQLLREVSADIALIATTSYLKSVYPQIVGCVEAGVNVISTAEELAYPWIKNPQLAGRIDGLAKGHGVTVLGTGVNPGFFFDTLPITLTGLCREVRRIEGVRCVPTGRRRPSFQRKIGTGMLPEAFMEALKRGEITGHVGLHESIALTAAALGWRLDEIRELPPKPVIAEGEVKTTYTTVKPGRMLGYIAVAEGVMDGRAVITYRLVMHAGVEEGYQEYIVDGEPSFRVRMSQVEGDWETAHMVVNMIPHVLNAPPGLLTMKDLPIPHALPEDVRIYLE